MSASRPSDLDGDAATVSAAVAAFRADLDRLLAEIGRRLVGQAEVAGAVVSALLAGGHVLLEGVPGLGKTLLVRTARGSAGADVLTRAVHPRPDAGRHPRHEPDRRRRRGGRRFEFQHGPIFAHVVLADEINRATPKTQSALLEAMQEQSVTVRQADLRAAAARSSCWPRRTRSRWRGPIRCPRRSSIGSSSSCAWTPRPAPSSHAILDRTTGAPDEPTRTVLDRDRLLEMRALVRQVPVARPIQDFVVRLVDATHPSRSPLGEVTRFVRYGSSPRGAQAIILAAKIAALRAGRFAPSFADVRQVALPALRHRVLFNFEGEAEGITADALVDKLLATLPEMP